LSPNNAESIKKFAIYILIITSSFGCVDVLPLPTGDTNAKLFVVCEVKVGEDIIADVTQNGNVTGKIPKPLDMPDTLNMSLSEGDYDFGISFDYDPSNKNFTIDSEKLKVKSGFTYKYRGIGTDVKRNSEPSVVIPSPVYIDTLIVQNFAVGAFETKYVTTVDCIIRLTKPEVTPSYLYIIPKTESQTDWKVVSFNKNIAAFKKTEHRSGFLVDYSLITDNEIHVTLSVKESGPTKKLAFELNSVTESFYRYNCFVSNITDSNHLVAENPAIAGFNIKTDKAFGTFSALFPTYRTFLLP
jgi:hypothetical protein